MFAKETTLANPDWISFKHIYKPKQFARVMQWYL